MDSHRPLFSAPTCALLLVERYLVRARVGLSALLTVRAELLQRQVDDDEATEDRSSVADQASN